jgi:aryl carrier-like protein
MEAVDLLERVRVAWADVLAADSVDGVPVDTNFLEAGGNSLLLVMLWEQLRELGDHPELKLSDLFQHGTVRAQAALLAGNAVGAPAVGAPAAGAADRRQLLGRARRGAPATAGAETE